MIRKYFKKWWAYGLFWGFWMWGGTVIVFPLFKDKHLDFFEVVFGLIYWLALGLFWGWAITPREEESKSKQENVEQ